LLTPITVLLAASAVYCGGMWLWLCGVSIAKRRELGFDMLVEFERQTFHLGLCFILSIGFLGLIGGAA
jgi:hypothetical protein